MSTNGLIKIAGPPHCCNCANSRETEQGWVCDAEMWGGSLIYPESVSMSWDWGVWAKDGWVGFIKHWGCQSYNPAECHGMKPTDREQEWAQKVRELMNLEVLLDTQHQVNRKLLDEYDLLDAEVYRLTEELRDKGEGRTHQPP